MMKLTKGLAVLAAAAVAVTGQAVYANCQDAGSVYFINQCGAGSFFMPPPAGSGPVTAAYFQLGKGNLGLLANAAVTGATAGNCFLATGAGGPGYYGCDSGTLGDTLDSIGLEGGEQVGGPPGSLCFGSAASWTRVGNDGCCDNVPMLAGPGIPPLDDNILNNIAPYYESGVGTSYDEFYVDSPIGLLLRESSGKHFALAFVSSQPRSAGNTLPGGYRLDSIGQHPDLSRRGDPNPAKPAGTAFDVIPWQNVPNLNIDQVLNLTATTADLQVSWGDIRIIDDGVSKPGPNAGRCGGVGTRDCIPLASPEVAFRRTVQRGTHNGTACGTFVNDPAFGTGGVLPAGAGSMLLTNVPRGTCFRMLTNLGMPAAAGSTDTLPNCRLGRCGDRSVTPYPDPNGPPASNDRFIAPPGVSNQVTVLSAKASGSGLSLNFNTSSELNVTRFDVYVKDARGRETLISSVDPQGGTTGQGADYSLSLTRQQLGVKGFAALSSGKTLFVVSQPSGQRSNEVSLK